MATVCQSLMSQKRNALAGLKSRHMPTYLRLFESMKESWTSTILYMSTDNAKYISYETVLKTIPVTF